jgi:glycosyltransferase involved in cell wall biosynthesis
MRILLVGRSLEIGGAERQLALTANALAGRGHKVSLALLYCRGPLLLDLADSDVEIADLGKRGRYSIHRVIWRFARLLRTFRPDVIYAHLPVQNLLALFGSLLLPGSVVVWGLRGSEMVESHYDYLSRTVRSLEAFASKWADLTIVNSRSGEQHAIQRGFPRERLAIIYNGIDLDRFKPNMITRLKYRSLWGIDPQTVVIGHVGRIDAMKDHHSFFQALLLLKAGPRDFKAVCVAAGPESAVKCLRERAEALGILDVVEIVNQSENAAEIIAAFDVFCSSSAFGEGFSNVIAEAMACGIPCVATDVGEARDLIGDTGIVVPPRSPDALAEALALMCNRIVSGDAAPASDVRARIMPFTPMALAEKLEMHFEASVLPQQSRSG